MLAREFRRGSCLAVYQLELIHASRLCRHMVAKKAAPPAVIIWVRPVQRSAGHAFNKFPSSPTNQLNTCHEDLNRLGGYSVTMHARSWSTEPWHGRTKIILGIDLGTTQSSVSFAHLFDGEQTALCPNARDSTANIKYLCSPCLARRPSNSSICNQVARTTRPEQDPHGCVLRPTP